MVANDPSAVLNAVICGVIVIVLMFYRRGDATHRPPISLLAYVMVLVYASVPFRFVFGLYESSHWLVVMVNILTGCCRTYAVWLYRLPGPQYAA